jgi:hypothetical protein
MLVINIFGASGSGKSTFAAGIFYEMKILGLNVEYVPEYAKDMVWEQRFNIMEDPIYMLGKQHRRIARLTGLVDYVVVDSPILLSHFYLPAVLPYRETFEKLVDEVYASFDNINILMVRNHSYTGIGRREKEHESDDIGFRMKKFLIDNNIGFSEIKTKTLTPKQVVTDVLNLS